MTPPIPDEPHGILPSIRRIHQRWGIRSSFNFHDLICRFRCDYERPTQQQEQDNRRGKRTDRECPGDRPVDHFHLKQKQNHEYARSTGRSPCRILHALPFGETCTAFEAGVTAKRYHTDCQLHWKICRAGRAVPAEIQQPVGVTLRRPQRRPIQGQNDRRPIQIRNRNRDHLECDWFAVPDAHRLVEPDSRHFRLRFCCIPFEFWD